MRKSMHCLQFINLIQNNNVWSFKVIRIVHTQLLQCSVIIYRVLSSRVNDMD
nr:hypothetical protein Iba_chr01bCG16260 [Ipomoea batatas]GMC54934.1 hypothetical protein Iba_chr01eCG2630 [Ipomoea batatas]